jgi:tetratricopeptide (TPR) repeat protein
LTRAAFLLALAAAACGEGKPAEGAGQPGVDPELGAAALPMPADEGARALIDEAYAHKQAGRNGPALAALDKACAAIARTSGEASADFGSCLDDRASVLLRMGRADEARALFERAVGILAVAKGADPRLVHGVRTRLEELALMAAKGITCAEPAEPPATSDLPYFPDVGAYQEALGALNPYVAVCANGVPEAVTVRVILTGDGRAIRAETRGNHAGTPLGDCVVEKLLAAIPAAKLPRFGACYRGFTYPFMVGKHESRQGP